MLVAHQAPSNKDNTVSIFSVGEGTRSVILGMCVVLSLWMESSNTITPPEVTHMFQTFCEAL